MMADPVSPMPDDPNDVGADAPGTNDQGTEQSKVLLTVLDIGGGTYKLIKGDEDEGGSAGDDTGGAGDMAAASSMGAGSAAPPDAGSSESDEGQTFDSVGQLLKGILDILQSHEAGADGSEDDNMAAGYSGADTGAPTMKQPPAMMRA